MRPRIALALVWGAFLVRGSYYCVQQPIWEGLDEWAQFACLQHFAEHRHMPRRSDPVSDEVVRSLELVPLAYGTESWGANGLSHDAYWQLPAAERQRRHEELERLTASYRRPVSLPPAARQQYEAQQPPLYYALLVTPYLAIRNRPLPEQVLCLRLLSLTIASLTILFGYAVAREVPAARRSAVLVAAMLACMPALAMDLSRIGNHVLAIPLTSAVLLCALRAVRRRRTRDWALLGTLLAAALLAKGYALVMVPVVILAAALAAARNRRAVAGGALALALAFAGAGWWYANNLRTTGTIAGEQMDVAARAGAAEKLAAVGQVQWVRVLDSAAMTHIWIGGWSFLLVRSWMYRVFELLAAASVAGILMMAGRLVRDPRFSVLAGAWLLFCLAMGYFSLTTFLAMHFSAGVGWYLNAIVVAEAVLLACAGTGLAGVRRAGAYVALAALLALALDLYTVHFLLGPYYTGLIRHRPSGALETFHIGYLSRIGIQEYSRRLTPPWLWMAYLCANFGLAAVIVKSARQSATSRSARNPPAAPARRW
jgi:4-amino-4-deoxy-L-arabinose transferase-like glycosyltransferase